MVHASGEGSGELTGAPSDSSDVQAETGEMASQKTKYILSNPGEDDELNWDFDEKTIAGAKAQAAEAAKRARERAFQEQSAAMAEVADDDSEEVEEDDDEFEEGDEEDDEWEDGDDEDDELEEGNEDEDVDEGQLDENDYDDFGADGSPVEPSTIEMTEEEYREAEEAYIRAFDQPTLTQEMVEAAPANHRSGYVALVGRPNAGKSTLLNLFLMQKLSAVTYKAQTTRHRILGILTEQEYQLIVLDTPGVISRVNNKLDEKMMHNVNTAVQQADALLVVVDATSNLKQVLQMPGMAPGWRGPPAALVLNKADLLRPEQLQEAGNWLRERTAAAAILPISASRNVGVEAVQAWAVQQLPLGPPLYPPDSVSDMPERFFVAEIIREQIFLMYRQEVPYCTAVRVTDFIDRTPPRKSYIAVDIVVESTAHRPILIGKGGNAIKRLSTASRLAIEDLLQRKVYLMLSIKIDPKWRKDNEMLNQLGY